MASRREAHTADFFKKDPDHLEDVCGKISNFSIKNRTKSKTVQNQILENCETTSSDYDYCTEDSDSDDDQVFNNEDRVFAKLYRQVVDEIMVKFKLRESNVNNAISKMKSDINSGHKNGFRRFEIDFRNASNRCAYLRRYAICHTGLVKRAMWRFFAKKSKLVCDTLFTTDQLKIVSLGGGPGSELVGFCCALQENCNNTLKELDLKIVDVSQGWVSVFSSVLKTAFNSNFGSLSKLLKNLKITTSFLQSDLKCEASYDNKTLCSVLRNANIVLMVKVLSFIPQQEAESTILKIVDAMKVGALLVFIDQPYNQKLFQEISCLKPRYHHFLRYELSFNPSRYHCPAINLAHAHVGVFEKETEISSESDSSDSEYL